MKELQSVTDLNKRLWRHLSGKRKSQFLLLIILMIVVSLAEVVSIGAVIPFIAIFTSDEIQPNSFTAHLLHSVFENADLKSLLLPISLFFALSAILAGSLRLTLMWLSIRLSFAVGGDFSISIYSKALHQPYSTHISTNTDELISAITNKVNSLIGNCIYPAITIISSCFTLILISITLILLDPLIAFLAYLIFISFYLIIIKYTKKRLEEDSRLISFQQSQVIKLMNEGLGGIRDTIINNTQQFYISCFKKTEISLRKAIGNQQIIVLSPRYILEVFSMVLLSILVYVLGKETGNILEAMPVIVAFAFAAQKLLPLFQSLFASWTLMRGGKASNQDALDLLDRTDCLDAKDQKEIIPMRFENDISLKNIFFKYSEQGDMTLKGIDLDIEKGSRIGIIGTSGCGKSTLMDILMGLLNPTSGSITIDKNILNKGNMKSWQSNIAHVPQSIYIFDGSILENIAMGIDRKEINNDRVYDAAQKANISSLIESWPEGYETKVGERGIKMSGGQRQRLGIARALYKKAELIILDEATSALDIETENQVMESIGRLSKEITLIIVSHRNTTLKFCNKIIYLDRGRVKKILSYEELDNIKIK